MKIPVVPDVVTVVHPISPITGFVFELDQTSPRCETVEPPSLVTFPPNVATVFWIAVELGESIEGATRFNVVPDAVGAEAVR